MDTFFLSFFTKQNKRLTETLCKLEKNAISLNMKTENLTFFFLVHLFENNRKKLIRFQSKPENFYFRVSKNKSGKTCLFVCLWVKQTHTDQQVVVIMVVIIFHYQKEIVGQLSFSWKLSKSRHHQVMIIILDDNRRRQQQQDKSDT